MAIDLKKIQDRVTKASGVFQTNLMKYEGDKKALTKLVDTANKLAGEKAKIKDQDSEDYEKKQSEHSAALKKVHESLRLLEGMKGKMFESQNEMIAVIDELDAAIKDKKTSKEDKKEAKKLLTTYQGALEQINKGVLGL